MRYILLVIKATHEWQHQALCTKWMHIWKKAITGAVIRPLAFFSSQSATKLAAAAGEYKDKVL